MDNRTCSFFCLITIENDIICDNMFQTFIVNILAQNVIHCLIINYDKKIQPLITFNDKKCYDSSHPYIALTVEIKFSLHHRASFKQNMESNWMYPVSACTPSRQSNMCFKVGAHYEFFKTEIYDPCRCVYDRSSVPGIH